MKHFYKLLSIFILLPFLSIAQSNYKAGYVVTIKGDTLRGYIDYRGWDINPTHIRFQPLTNLKAIKFSAADITYFDINKIAKYQRYIGPVSMDDASADHMIEYRDTSYSIDTVFLEILQKGKNVALYSYSDSKKERFFIGEAPDYKPVELVYRLYYDMAHASVVNGTGRTVNENTYKRQLYYLAVKHNTITDDLKKDIDESNYRPIYLIQVVKQINRSSNK